ncbi:MAG: hypothetical protein M1820_008893 [Bogoriella megaspora]|nr:MAG: hypothetical protein M1820_008893 [Bogoriella megaspora]
MVHGELVIVECFMQSRVSALHVRNDIPKRLNQSRAKNLYRSTIIDDLRNHTQVQTGSELAFFYFSFSDSRTQSCQAFFASIVAQLFQVNPKSQVLHLLYSRSGHETPSIQSLRQALLEMVDEFMSVYIVIDALDECFNPPYPDYKEHWDWLQQITELKIDKLHILVLSRKEPELKQVLNTAASLPPISVVDGDINHDISLYVYGQLHRDRKLKALDDSKKRLIADTLLRKANGMFRWVFCQLEALKKLRPLRDSDYERTLQSLPATLDETYERILLDLETCQQEVFKALQWLAFTFEPVTIEELADACDIDPHTEIKFNKDDKIIPQRLLEALSGLIIQEGISGQLPKVRLAHFSVEEYLVSDRIRRSGASAFSLRTQLAHALILETCVAYISYYQEQESSYDIVQLTSEFSHSPYACRYWYRHMQYCLPSDKKRLSDKITPKFATQSWLASWIPRDRVPYNDPWFPYSKQFSHPALYHAAVRGLDLVVENLLQRNSSTSICAQIEIDIALQAASSQGMQDVAKSLIQHGANVNVDSYATPCGNALQAAIDNNHWDTFQLLLARGADYESFLGCVGFRRRKIRRDLVTAAARYSGNALQMASIKGRKRCVEELLKRGAKPTAQSDDFPLAPLHLASYHGHEEVVKILLAANVDANHQVLDKCWTPLHLACYNGHEEVTLMLLDGGAKVSAGHKADCGKERPLEDHLTREEAFDAMLKGRLTREETFDAILEGLCQHSFFPSLNNKTSEKKIADAWTPLHFAAGSGHAGIVKMLLDRGTNPNSRGPKTGIVALELALINRHIATVRCLLDAGAEVFVGRNSSKPLLYAARQDPYYEMLLLRSGMKACTVADLSIDFADVPESVAVDLGLTSIFKRLMEDYAFRKHCGTRVLHVAGRLGAFTAAKFLIDRGANVNANSSGKSVLEQTMDFWGTFQDRGLFNFLLDSGADINACSAGGQTMLQRACWLENVSFIEFLLDRGAEVDKVAPATAVGTPLQLLCGYGPLSAVKLLLERGANVHKGS